MSKKVDKSKSYTIAQFRADFPNDDACLDKMFYLQYNGSFCCPKCKTKSEFKRVKGRRSYRCCTCDYHLYPTKGTIFEKSTTPLTIWFYAMFLFAKSKNGLSACELERQTGVNYKTAWRILMKIRSLATSSSELMTGIIECDETFVGGKNKNRHKDKKIKHSQGRSYKDKTPVFGMLQRNGEVRTFVIKNTNAENLKPHIFRNVAPTSTVYTDDWYGYEGLSSDYTHGRIDHGKGRYADGDITTNRIENFWSVFKRTINGSYVRVTPKYLQQYANEVAFRYSNRDKNVFRELFKRLRVSSLKVA